MQEEERAEAKGEPEMLVGESRKMKRVTEEAKAEQRNEKVRRLISDKAAALMDSEGQRFHS